MSDLFDLEKIVSSADASEVVNTVLKDSKFDIKTEMNDRLPYTRRASVNEIVPEEYQQRLMAIDDTMSNCFWLIGDITTELVGSVNHTKAKENGKLISKTDIFEAVGIFCHRTSRSIRYYYECARYFPIEVRQKYDVPFSVYAEARWVKDWELLLQIAEENPIWSAERVRAEYYKSIGEEPPVRTKIKTDSGAEIEDEEIPEVEPKFKDVLLSKLDHSVDDLRAVLDRLPLSTGIRVRIGDVLIEIQDIEIEIRREM